MNCADFQRRWDELLDAESGVGSDRPPAVDELEARLLAHAADCPACRPAAARYQVLRQAIRAWRQPPVPSADLTTRILSAPAETAPRPWIEIAADLAQRSWRDRRIRYRLVLCGTVAAAAVLGMFVSGWAVRRQQLGPPVGVGDVADRDLHSIASPPRAPDGPLDLDRAVAEATSATWDLARSASEPAARIGRDVLEASPPAGDEPARRPVESGGGAAGLSLSFPSWDPLKPDATAASAVLQEVGDRVSAGVEPISDTARHAFGFLLGPPRPRAGGRDRQPGPEGARSG
jgi:hypothetical protein